MSARPLNYTTKIPVRQTVGECSDLLADAGADMVAVVYEGRKPVGLSFRLQMPSGQEDFKLPVNVPAVAKLLDGMAVPASMRNDPRLKRPDHAAEVAWRVIKDWLEAQLALIAAEMVSLDQVMLPYLQLASGTLYEAVRDQHLALPAGQS